MLPLCPLLPHMLGPHPVKLPLAKHRQLQRITHSRANTTGTLLIYYRMQYGTILYKYICTPKMWKLYAAKSIVRYAFPLAEHTSKATHSIPRSHTPFPALTLYSLPSHSIPCPHTLFPALTLHSHPHTLPHPHTSFPALTLHLLPSHSIPHPHTPFPTLTLHSLLSHSIPHPHTPFPTLTLHSPPSHSIPYPD